MRKVFQQNHRPALSIFLGFLFSILIAVMPMINRLYVKYKVVCKNCTEVSPDLGTVLTFVKFQFILLHAEELKKVDVIRNDPLDIWRTMMAGSPLFVLSSFASRLFTASLSFFLLTVAQRAYQQRLTAGKNFCLTLGIRS